MGDEGPASPDGNEMETAAAMGIQPREVPQHLQGESLLHFLHKTVPVLGSTPDNAALFRTLMELAYSPMPAIASGFSGLPLDELREGCMSLLEEMFSKILPTVHQQPGAMPEMLMEFAEGPQLQMLIEASLRNVGHRNSILLRYLHILTIGLGEVKGVDVICRYIFTITDPPHLEVLCAYLATVIPYMPALMGLSYEVLLDHWTAFDRELKGKGDSSFENSLRWLLTLRILIQLEKGAKEGQPIKYNGFHPGPSTGPLLTKIMSWLLDRLETAVENNDTQRVCDAAMAVERLLGALGSGVDRKAPLPNHPGKQQLLLIGTRDIYKLSMQLAKLLQLVLFAVDYRDHPTPQQSDPLDAFVLLRNAISHFYNVEMSHLCSYYIQWLILCFVDGCLQDGRRLFAEYIELAHDTPTFLASEFDADFADDTVNLLGQLDGLTKRKQAHQLAHTGIIGQGKSRAPPPPTVRDQLRRMTFLDSVHQMMSTVVGRERQMKTARAVANLLLHRVCGDSVGADYAFADYDLEKEMINRYVVISRRLSTSVCDGLLGALSFFYPITHYLIPVIKAAILESMALLESSYDRLVQPPGEKILHKIDTWMRMGLKAGLLPACLCHIGELLSLCSSYEAFLIIHEIYNHFKLQPDLHADAEEMFARAVRGEACRQQETMRTPALYELMIAILQRDMAQRGRFFEEISLLMPSADALMETEANGSNPAAATVHDIAEPLQ